MMQKIIIIIKSDMFVFIRWFTKNRYLNHTRNKFVAINSVAILDLFNLHI